MPNTKVSKGDIKNFLSYSKWIYIILAVVLWMLSDILYSATEYQSPDERQVCFQLVASYAETEITLPTVAEKALAAGQEYDETLEEVVFYHIAYDPDDTSDAYGSQKYLLMLAVGEGDVYMVERSLMEQLVDEGYCLPLEGYIATGLLDPGDVDLESVTYHESAEIENYDPNATHVYGVPMKNMNAMLGEDINFDNRERYMVLMAFSANPDTSVVVMNDVIAQLTAPLPEWAAAAAERQQEEGTNAFDSALMEAGLATQNPEATAAPAITDAPEATAAPSATDVPEATSTPTATAAPIATAMPTATPDPGLIK